jgi:hypothetical protein
MQQMQRAQQQQGQYYQPPPVNQQVPPYAQQPQSKQNPIVEAFAALGLLFLLRRSVRTGYSGRYQRRSSGCCGVLVAIVILGIIAAVVYNVYRSASTSIRNANLNSITSSNGSGNSNQTTQPPITTTKINQAVTYSGVNITILDVQQSKSFLDDSQSQANGIARVRIKEQTSDSTGNFLYSDIARIILPDKTSVAPLNAQQAIGPNAGVSRSNWLDFPVPASDKADQLTLQLGTDSQAQVSIPLTGKANLSQFQTKTSTPNVKTQYAGLTWTVTSASASLSIRGKQADKGMLYVTVTLSIDNPTPHDFNAYYGDYIRLKSGATTSSPDTATNFPTSFTAGSSNQKGSLYFAMPQGSTSYTLMFLANANGFSQATVDFQLG